ncbi:PH domain-containing protein [uncultured Paludibaculum sp.]|uniref:PH domain-containing protein n=1 Tax=uncultured Paludibaculum sp. TaxID=1765020 RepID=UPI002AAC025A|nr:PH domain-containing protein [uncultured Paludibaculum sp.]
MAALWKNLLLVLLFAGGVLFLALAVRSAGALKAAATPASTGLAQIPELFELWNETLGYAIFALALLGGGCLIAHTHWGLNTEWNGDVWVEVYEAIQPLPDFEVHEPGESWKANLFYGCVLGLPFGLSALFAEGKWTAARAFWVALGFGFLLWMVQSSVENYSRTVRLSSAGLEEQSIFGRRRIPWDEIGGLEFRDVRAQVERMQDWRTRRSSTLPHIDVWAVNDRHGRELLTLPAGMEPQDVFRKMREQIEKRASAR